MRKNMKKIEEPAQTTNAPAAKNFKKVNEFWQPTEPGEQFFGYLKTRDQGIKTLAEPDEQGRKERPYDIACMEEATPDGVKNGRFRKISVGTVLSRKFAAAGNLENKLLMIEYTGQTEAKPGQNPAKLFELYVAED